MVCSKLSVFFAQLLIFEEQLFVGRTRPCEPRQRQPCQLYEIIVNYAATGKTTLNKHLSKPSKYQRAFLTMKSTTDFGSFGESGKCPSPALTITVIIPPRS